MLLNKIKMIVVSSVFLSFAAADMETKPIESVTSFASFEVDSKEPQLKYSYNRLNEFFQYSKDLQKRGVTGKVIVEFDVTQIGSVTNSKIIQGSSDELNKIVLSGIQFLEFKPGMQNGTPVKIRHRMPVIFE
tara:strand:- start:115 stop:510 length:396 start_codon:yes stop_codon:yes gene_type:complete